MKELSIKEKARRYDEAIETAKRINDGDGVESPPDWTTCEVIFPELREGGSEDEKIKKSLIILLQHFCKGYRVPGLDFPVSYKDMLAWLEKQGERCDCFGEVDDKALQQQFQIWFEKGKCSGRDEVIFHPEDFGLQKQDEQKPAYKIGSKFDVGDWITDGYNKIRIVSVKDGVYKYSNNYILGNIKSIDERYHLWTIQDAKDGDILVTKEGKRPFIFKDFLDEIYSESLVAYCGIDTEDEFVISSMQWPWTDKEVEPATKEQCNLLFSRMHEAGYVWDKEKEKLIEIMK